MTRAPRRWRKTPLVKREISATIVSITDPQPLENYKIATAVLPDYEHLELLVNSDSQK
jgi:hypothetical protein